jgi:hypothetical protein
MFSTGDSKGFAGGCTFILESGQTRHLAAHATLPYVLSVDEYANSYDNITGTEQQFTSRYRTRWMDAGSYSQKKMWRRPDIVIKQAQTNSTLRFDIYSDYEESTTTKTYSIDIPNAGSGMLWGVSKWGEAEWGASNFGSQIVNARSIGLARAIQVEFSGSVGAKWGINSLTMKYNPRKVTK